MDHERRIALGIRIIRTTYRVEQRRLDEPHLDAFRDRANAILAALEADAARYPELAAEWQRARQELLASTAEPSS